MKKFFKLLVLSLVLALPIVSCSTDDVSAKQGETDRSDLEIPGDNTNPTIVHNQLALYVSATSVPVGTLVSFTTMLNGEDVTNQVTYFVNGIQIGGSSISSTLNGTFRVQAKLEGYIDSRVATVIYGNGTTPEPEPSGNFIYNGTGYNTILNILVLNGASMDEGSTTVARTYWTSIVLNNTNIDQATVGAAIDFTTPFTITGPNEGEYSLPNGTNEVYIGMSEIFVNAIEFENVIGTGNIHYTSPFNYQASTNAFRSTVNFNGNSLQINYNGAYRFIDNSENEARPQQRQATQRIELSSNKNRKSFRIK